MKTLITIVLLSLLSFSTKSQNLKSLDDKNGFRDVKFEAPTSSIKGLVKIKIHPSFADEYPNYDGYTKTGEDLRIGKCILKEVQYWFYKNQLCDINITLPNDYSNAMDILKIFEVAYGPAEKEEKAYGKWIEYHWRGEKVQINFEILYKSTGEIGESTITINSEKIQSMQLADKQEKENRDALEAAKKL